jgi:hypothetical protein
MAASANRKQTGTTISATVERQLRDSNVQFFTTSACVCEYTRRESPGRRPIFSSCVIVEANILFQEVISLYSAFDVGFCLTSALTERG